MKIETNFCRKMQNVPIDGLILIRENNSVCGLPIWSYFVRKAINADFNVNILLILHTKELLPQSILSLNRYFL